jgi:hypothetical protein
MAGQHPSPMKAPGSAIPTPFLALRGDEFAGYALVLGRSHCAANTDSNWCGMRARNSAGKHARN